jgi:phosphoribosyl 1,2-cyclic phosphodiesterase
MPDGDDFFVKFWGARGSIACPGPETARYGGNNRPWKSAAAIVC